MITKDFLNEVQQRGMNDYNLSLYVVRSKHYGSHFLKALNKMTVKYNNGSNNQEEVINTLLGLNEAQTAGISIFKHNPDDVKAKNFTDRTLEGMDTLIRQGRAKNYNEAF